MRDRFLNAAMALLTEEGPEALSIRSVAKRVGVSHMVLYTYFENRDALLSALRERHRGWMEARHAQELRRAEAGDVRQVMRESLAFYAQISRELPGMYTFLWVLPETVPQQTTDRPQELDSDLQHLSHLIRLGIERFVFLPRDPALAAATALAIVNAPLILHHSGRLSDSALRDQMAAEALGVAMSYLCGSHLAHRYANKI